MHNWLGQEISVQQIVYRGARDRNYSSYKVGIVVKANEEKDIVTVRYLLEDSYWNVRFPSGHVRCPVHYRYINSKGTLNPEGLFGADSLSYDNLAEMVARSMAVSNVMVGKTVFTDLDEFNNLVDQEFRNTLPDGEQIIDDILKSTVW
jgi:hypothetical protein